MDLAEIRQLAADQASAQRAAEAFAAKTRAAFGPRLMSVRLFGSLARGDWMGPEDSDVDIAVILKTRAAQDVGVASSLATEQVLTTGFVFSPLVLSEAEFAQLRARELRLARDILEEGVEL